MIPTTHLHQGHQSGHFIAAPWRSSGKTMITMGLTRAATNRSLQVQTYKKGPDFIDPLWLASASGRPCFNLDSYIQSPDELAATYRDHLHGTDVVLVEGTMGLHDGLAEDGSDSNASIARQLGIPVVLVIDCRGMHRTIAALLNGIQHFDPELEFSGVILNRIRTKRHADKIVRAITGHSDLEVLGVVPELPEATINEAELGLLPAPAHAHCDQAIEHAARLMEQNCNLEKLLPENTQYQQTPSVETIRERVKPSIKKMKIGIAKDEAFHFYYEDDLSCLRSKGAQLITVSPLGDTFPTDLDGLIIGGGFPERHAEALSKNKAFKQGVSDAIRNGLPVHAECAGLMYLCNSIEVGDIVWPMVCAIDGAVAMCKTPKGRGYMKLRVLDGHRLSDVDQGQLRAHEFHHSEITFNTPPVYLYQVERGYGIDGKYDGIVVHNVVASYAHFRHTGTTPWVDWFIDRVLNRSASSKIKVNNV